MNNRFCRCCFSDHNADDTVCWRLLSLPSDNKADRAHKGDQNAKLDPWVSNLTYSSAGQTKIGAKDIFLNKYNARKRTWHTGGDFRKVFGCCALINSRIITEILPICWVSSVFCHQSDSIAWPTSVAHVPLSFSLPGAHMKSQQRELSKHKPILSDILGQQRMY